MTDNPLGPRMALTGWRGGTAGFRVDAVSRSRVLAPLKGTLRGIEIELPGVGVRPYCRITPTSWTTCPELRSAEIGRWMTRRREKPWPRGNPPSYDAELIGIDGGTARIRVVVKGKMCAG